MKTDSPSASSGRAAMKLKNQTKKDHTMKKSDKKAENRKTAGVEKKIVKVQCVQVGQI